MGNVLFPFFCIFPFEKLISSSIFSNVQEIKKHRSDVKKITAKLKNRDTRVAQLEDKQLETNNILVLTAPADNNPRAKSKQINKGQRGVKGAVGVSDTAAKQTKRGGGGQEEADSGEGKGGKGSRGGKEKRGKGEKEKAAANREKGEKEKSGSRGKTLTFIKQNLRSW